MGLFKLSGVINHEICCSRSIRCGGACGTIDVDRLQRTIEKAATQAAAR